MGQGNDWFFEIITLTSIRYSIIPERLKQPMESRVTGVKIKVENLLAGDLYYEHLFGYHVFVCKGPHPIWPELQVVVWCNPQGDLSVDALSAHQVLNGSVINRGEAQNQRALRFRQWYLERHANDGPH